MIEYQLANKTHLEQYLSFMDRNHSYFHQYEIFKGPKVWTNDYMEMMIQLDHERFIDGDGVRVNAFHGELQVGTGSVIGLRQGVGIIGILVDFMFARKGIATEIISRLESITSKYKCEYCQMHVHVDNKPSMALAQSLNYYPKEKRDNIWIFEKRIL